MTTQKMEALLKKHAGTIEKTSRDLAMNFDIPARDIIAMACSHMGITPKQWDELTSYQIEKEQAV